LSGDRGGLGLRSIPKMDLLLSAERIFEFEHLLGRDLLKRTLEEVLDRKRREILEGMSAETCADEVIAEALSRLRELVLRRSRKVINATGVVLHTNLGRAPLARQAVEAVEEVSCGYCNLEYDLVRGDRGHRNDHIEDLICALTGAEAALAVNNNAAAVLLVLSALACGKEVVVSRGELVEIGGSFRIPDVMRFSGARLVEVGTTNRTHLFDYEMAIGPNTAAIMKVHTSNFRVMGFVSSVSRRELSALARSRGVLLIEDLGSGLLVDLSPYGLRDEPRVGDCLEEGVDLVTFSGDKMLGGPQMGYIAGRKDLVDSMRKHPFVRAVRPDKMALAAAEATLSMYLQGRWREIPALRMLSEEVEVLRARALRLLDLISGVEGLKAELIDCFATTGGGAFPLSRLPDVGVALSSPSLSAEEVSRRLRVEGKVPVIGVLEGDRVVLHMRTVSDEELDLLGGVIRECLSAG